MKVRELALIGLLISPVAISGNHWQVTLPAGNMRFQGEIISESCRVESGDKDMVVLMGQISSNRFHAVGEDVNPIPFSIHLIDCSTAVSENVGISFYGVADTKNPDLLSVGTEADSATGVGIALFDENEKLIPINSPQQHIKPLRKGPMTLNFIAKYRAISEHITGGKTTAQAWFALTYE